MAADLNILVVDDTVTYRQILSRLVSEIDGATLVGTASNGKIALSRIGMSETDLVLLDMYMPVMDGLETLKSIKTQYPHIEVIMLSAFDEGNAKLTVLALENGALDFIPKPSGGSAEENISKLRTSLFPLMSLVKTRKFSRKARSISISDNKTIKTPKKTIPEKISLKKPDTIPSWKKFSEKPIDKLVEKTPKKSKDEIKVSLAGKKKIGQIDVVGLGVSTGGPNALLKVIPLINKEFQVPILCVQHMPPMFTASLAERLDKLSNIEVVEAKDGEVIKNGRMYIAPGGRHMVARKGASDYIIGLVDTPPVNSCRPAVDVLFRSMINIFGGNILTVIMTGMGNDGMAGVSAIRRKGGYSIVQDESSSVVWGMPGAVAKSDNADEIVVLDNMAVRIEEIVTKGKIRC